MLSWVKWALSFCALALFAAGAFVCVAKLVRAPAVGPARRRAARREMLLAALAFLLFAAFVQGVVALCAVRQSPGAGLENALAQFFGGIDAPHAGVRGAHGSAPASVRARRTCSGAATASQM